jgi:hypothetical protein
VVLVTINGTLFIKNLRSLGFEKGWKLEIPEKKTLNQGRELSTNSTPI